MKTESTFGRALGLLLPTLLIGSLIVMAGCGHDTSSDETGDEMMEDEAMMEEEHDETMEEEMMEDEDAMMESDSDDSDEATYSAAEFVPYTESAYTAALGKEPIALFFHAEWCGTCLQLESAIEKDLADFPNGTKIFEVNYDIEDELKKAYGVTSQSIVVVLDANGDVVETLAAPSTSKLMASIESSL